MAREKLFTEEGKVRFEGTNALKVGVPKKVTFTSEVRGEPNKFPSGNDKGRGTMTLKSHGKVVASYTGSLSGFEWDSEEVSELDGNKIKGKEKVKVTGFRKKQIEMDTEMDLSSGKFKNTGYG
jgi:hypothetical protein